MSLTLVCVACTTAGTVLLIEAMENIRVSDHTLTDNEGLKRSSTAVLRKRFAEIEALVAEGYSHKHICERLNAEGFKISYPYYRVIMTRLRSERKAKLGYETKGLLSSAQTVSVKSRVQQELPQEHRTDEREESVENKQLTWDPRSNVKWE
jgi:hypothetical protein